MPERLIDANALKAKIETHDAVLGGHDRIYICGLIDDSPTIEAEPVRHGWWIDWSMWGESNYQCSECNAEMKYKTNFCPRCGAKMQDGGAENG